jgi:hypothetical protein
MSSRTRARLKAMLLLLTAGGATLLAAERVRAREASQFEVLTGFSAKEACSCAFVVEQNDEYCVAFGQTGPVPVAVAIDHGAKTVTSTFLGTSRTARFTEGAGCLTDALP